MTLDELSHSTQDVRLAIARTKEGDRKALRFLFVRRSGNVHGYIHSVVHDEKAAEGLTRQAFPRAPNRMIVGVVDGG